MALLLADRVKDTTTTTGTGNITLAGSPPTGYQSFNTAFGTSNPLYYCIEGGAEWEVGQGYLSASTTLVRSTVLASSNSGSAVSFSAGTKNVFSTMPASTGGKWIDILKVADETRSSTTTLANDTHMLFAVEANSRYAFEMFIETYQDAGAFKYALSVPASVTSRTIKRESKTESGSIVQACDRDAVGSTAVTGTALFGYVMMRGSIVTGGTSGNVAFQWAQNSSNAAASYVLAGSRLRYAKLA